MSTLALTVHYNPLAVSPDQIRLYLYELLRPGEELRGCPGVTKLHFHDGRQMRRVEDKYVLDTAD